MMDRVIQDLKLTQPEFEAINFMETVNAPKKPNGARPDTKGTYTKLWEDHGEALTEQAQKQPDGKLPIAIISSQPHGNYQLQEALGFFRDKPVKVTVLAKAIGADVNLSVLFDGMARAVYAGKDLVMSKLAKPLEYDEKEKQPDPAGNPAKRVLVQ
jgi:hypothetical protein